MRMFTILKCLFWSKAPSVVPRTYMLINSDKASVIRDFPGFLCCNFFPFKCSNKTHSNYNSSYFLSHQTSSLLMVSSCRWCRRRGQLDSWLLLAEEGSGKHTRRLPNRFIWQVGEKHQPRKLKPPILDSDISEWNWTANGHSELRKPAPPATSITKSETRGFLLGQATLAKDKAR